MTVSAPGGLAPSPRRPRDGATARGLSRPTVLDGLREIAAVVGPAQALAAWSAAAVATGAHGMQLDVDEHLMAATWLAQTSPVAAVRTVARSLATRLRTYRILSGETS